VQVPVFGYKNSLNVACTAAVVVYEILRQWEYRP
jgi:tRNA(Leu) C34 or U34 (ribose-2'-O)-methylase TrmL